MVLAGYLSRLEDVTDRLAQAQRELPVAFNAYHNQKLVAFAQYMENGLAATSAREYAEGASVTQRSAYEILKGELAALQTEFDFLLAAASGDTLSTGMQVGRG